MATLIICRGIQASGKTTFAQQWVAETSNSLPNTRVRISRDDIRWEFFNKFWGLDHDQETFVTKRQHSQISAALRNGHDVIVDDTNLRARTVKDLLRVAKRVGAHVEHIDFPVDLDVAIGRDKNRASLGRRSVGEDVVRDFYQRYTPKGKFPPFPVLEPETDSGFIPYHGTPGRRQAVMCDLDGTLALLNGRSPYDETLVGTDRLNEAVHTTLMGYRALDYDIILMSGRTDGCQAATVQWLREHVRFQWAGLFMRKVGDTRKDAIVKHMMFWSFVAPNWDVKTVLDDRDQVVSMWREISLPTFQVAPGDF